MGTPIVLRTVVVVQVSGSEADSPQVMLVTQKPGSRRPSFSARPAVTFPASDRHRSWLITVYTA